MLVCLGFIHTLEIVARILRDVVNRERLCDTNAIWWMASAMMVLNVLPLERQNLSTHHSKKICTENLIINLIWAVYQNLKRNFCCGVG